MASKAALKHLTKEYVAMQREPPPFVWAAPDEKDILTSGTTGLAIRWRRILWRSRLLLPSEYPFKPPGIKMYTPSGRFQPDRKICFSMSDFHPGTWNPAWSVATILTGLLSFMLSDEMTTGSVIFSDADKQAFAEKSHHWNVKQVKFLDAFPEYCTPTLKDLPNMGVKEHGGSAPSLTSTAPNSMNIIMPSGPMSLVPQAGTEAASLEKAQAPIGSAAAWGTILWGKWRWGVLIMLAIMVSWFGSA